MTKPRKSTPEQETEALRVLALTRPEGEGWETVVIDGHLNWRRETPNGVELRSPVWNGDPGLRDV